MKTLVMKKNFIGLALGSAAFIFLGCSNPENTGPAAPSFAALTNYETALAVEYTLSLGYDTKECFSATVKYKDATGTTQTEAITGDPWTKSIGTVQLPFEAQIAVVYQAIEGADADLIPILVPDSTGQLVEAYELEYGQNLAINYRYELSDGVKTKNKPSGRIITKYSRATSFATWQSTIVTESANGLAAYSYTYTIAK
ncbi:MAG: hypothetical protein LBT01_02835 [Spirochaetaceae bacterium]|jgi:hypothetical protein|nr:hypothetical protein [Spirochaetaceae bacterium]